MKEVRGCLHDLVIMVLVTGGTLLAFVSLFFGSLKLLDTYRYYFGFSTEQWQQARDAPADSLQFERVSERSPMMPDLLAHHLRRGMSEQAVRTLLGAPDAVYPEGDSAPLPHTPVWEYSTYRAVSYHGTLSLQFVAHQLTQIWETEPHHP